MTSTSPIPAIPRPSQSRLSNGRAARGQSLVEFVLVLPMLLILLLTVADFGRLFIAGITLEAGARNGAEAAAIERLRAKPATPGDPAYYQRLRLLAAAAACSESRLLPNVQFDESTRTCGAMPLVAACIRDADPAVPGSGDPDCGELAPGTTGPLPPECADHLTTGWDNASGGPVASHAVEVRMCYEFRTLFTLDMALPFGWDIKLGHVWIHRSRTFVVDCPPGEVIAC